MKNKEWLSDPYAVPDPEWSLTIDFPNMNQESSPDAWKIEID